MDIAAFAFGTNSACAVAAPYALIVMHVMHARVRALDQRRLGLRTTPSMVHGSPSKLHGIQGVVDVCASAALGEKGEERKEGSAVAQPPRAFRFDVRVFHTRSLR